MTHYGGTSARAVSALLASMVALAVILSGCGDASKQTPAEQRASARAVAREKAAQQREQAAAQRRQRQTAVYKECQRVVGPLDAKLSALNSRLSVGLPFSKYGNEVGSAKVAYDKVIREAKSQGGISDVCINKVGTRLESALRAYVSAYNTWNNCIQDAYCSFDKGSRALTKTQKSWAKADRLVTRADTALTNLKP